MTQEAYDQVKNLPHKGHVSHDVIAAAAAWEAMKAWDEHKKKKGEEVNHSTAKQFLAAGASAFLTHIIETKGLDAIDHAKAKAAAEKQIDQQLNGGY